MRQEAWLALWAALLTAAVVAFCEWDPSYKEVPLRREENPYEVMLCAKERGCVWLSSGSTPSMVYR